MAKVEQFTCPACGAHEVKNIGGVNYLCDYCHSTFVVKEDNSSSKFNKTSGAFSGLNKDEILEKLRKGEFPFSTDFTETSETFHSTIDSVNVTPKPPVPKPARFVGIIVAVALIAFIGVGVSVFTLTNSAAKNSKSFLGDWQKPDLDNYDCLVGSKGAAVWLVLKNQTNKLDSVKYKIRVIDPVTKKIISEQALGNALPWKDLFNHSDMFDYEFFVVNDTVYNVSKEGGIQGFGLYTGKKLFGSEWFEKRFPELKDGIAKVDKEYYRKQLKITSASGDDFIYYFNTGKLTTKDENKKNKAEALNFSEDIYLLRDKKAKLYLCTMKRHEDDDYYLQPYYVENYFSKPEYSSSYIKKIAPIGDSVYAKALPIDKYNNNLLFFYASNFSKNAKGILALVNKEGQFVWRNNDTILNKIVAESNDNSIYFKYNLKNNLFVINLNGSPRQSIGVNLNSGKTQFVFTQSSSNID